MLYICRGAGQQVGSSSHILVFKGKKVMVSKLMYFDIKPRTHCNALLQQIAFVVRSIDKLHIKFTAAVRHCNKFHCF